MLLFMGFAISKQISFVRQFHGDVQGGAIPTEIQNDDGMIIAKTAFDLYVF